MDGDEEIGQPRRNAGRTGQLDLGKFEFEEVAQPQFGFAKGRLRLVEPRETGVLPRLLVGMFRAAQTVERVLHLLRVEPRAARFAEQGEEILRHAEKLSPHEQCATALGFVTLKPPFCRSSL